MTIEEIKSKVIPLLQSYEVSRAGLFGSAALGAMSKDSDIDILVDINGDMSLFKFIEMKQRLEEKLGKKVDLVEYQTIKPSLKEKILQNQKILL